MKDLKFGLIAILIVVLLLNLGILVKLNIIEGDNHNRYKSIIFGVDLCNDKVRLLAKEIHKMNEADIAYQTEVVKARNINNERLFKMVNEIRMNTWKLKVNSQRDLYLIFHHLEIIKENTTSLTFDELMDMAMEEDE